MSLTRLEHAGGSTAIHSGAGLLGDAELWAQYLGGSILVVSDRTVAGLYLERLQRAIGDRSLGQVLLEPGETAKTVASWQQVTDALVDLGARRDATVIALGGGVVGDTAGFAAATYMRGIRVIQAPTTLLAQVDAAIGGKTGVNHPAAKNLVGAFHQPAAVIADVETLATLEIRDYRAGLAEIVKYGAIRDAGFLDWLEERTEALGRRDPEAVAEAVQRSVRHKAEVVMADEREAGERALLNFGHTFGHALETATGYRHFRHGEAVAVGMVMAARLSAALGMIEPSQADRMERLLVALELPVQRPPEVAPEALFEHMQLDKKNRQGALRLVLLEAPGQAVIVDDAPGHKVMEILSQ